MIDAVISDSLQDMKFAFRYSEIDIFDRFHSHLDTLQCIMIILKKALRFGQPPPSTQYVVLCFCFLYITTLGSCGDAPSGWNAPSVMQTTTGAGAAHDVDMVDAFVLLHYVYRYRIWDEVLSVDVFSRHNPCFSGFSFLGQQGS